MCFCEEVEVAAALPCFGLGSEELFLKGGRFRVCCLVSGVGLRVWFGLGGFWAEVVQG